MKHLTFPNMYAFQQWYAHITKRFDVKVPSTRTVKGKVLVTITY